MAALRVYASEGFNTGQVVAEMTPKMYKEMEDLQCQSGDRCVLSKLQSIADGMIGSTSFIDCASLARAEEGSFGLTNICIREGTPHHFVVCSRIFGRHLARQIFRLDESFFWVC